MEENRWRRTGSSAILGVEIHGRCDMRKAIFLLFAAVAAMSLAGCSRKNASASPPAATQPQTVPVASPSTPSPTALPHPRIEGRWTVVDNQEVPVSSLSSWRMDADSGGQVAFTGKALIDAHSIAMPYEWLDANHIVLHIPGGFALAIEVTLQQDTLRLRTFFGAPIATMKRSR